MASNINPYNIDGTYPIAGQDNSSQGFRNNFTNIKNNFAFAESEISDLQSKAIVSSALNGQTIVNDMAGTQIKRPQLTSWTQSLIDLGTISGTATLDFTQANFQKITTAGAITVSLVNWPASVGNGAVGYGLMRVWINVTNAAHTVTLPSNVDIAVNDIAGYNSATQTITFDATGSYVFDISSVDSGQNYLIFDVTRNRSSFRDPGFYYNDMINSTLLIGYSPYSIQTALALEQGQDKVSVNGSFNSVSAGNLALANVQYTQSDTGPIGGYSITGMRGNLQTGTITPVHGGDLLGYVNSLTYTGTGGTANAFQQSASINFFATGANVAYGLGGNIAFFTADDGGVAFDATYQAMGIENNQSVKMYGNAEVAGTFKTDAGIVEGGTVVDIMATTGGSFTANSAISTLVIDSTGSATIATANIILPSNPQNGQKFVISTVAPITSANVWAPASALVKYVASNKFTGGNVRTSLTYISAVSTWYTT
jgi:hypothetical protein